MAGDSASWTVLVLHVGPVQSFIESARRFSDLWAGSRLLSDLARAAASGVAEAGGELVFPDSIRDEGGVANKVLAVCKDAGHAARAADAGCDALRRKWEEVVAAVREERGAVLLLDEFDDQAAFEDWGELLAAWATRPTYAEARQAAERLLDARKRTRDFRQRDRAGAPAHGEALAKSWQDPGREDVLDRSKRQELERLRRQLLLKGQERLDALGAVKRFLRDRRRFESVNDVTIRAARAAFIKDEKSRDRLVQFERDVHDALSREVTGRWDGALDGSWYYPERLLEEATGAGLDEGTKESLARSLAATGFRPTPYYALVVADGDGMGEAIDARRTVAEHRTLSGALARFAAEAGGIVSDSREGFWGTLLYCGGDDLLAVFPLDTAVDGVEAVAGRFAESMGGGMSISAGIAVAHMLEPFDRVRAWASQAKVDAKAWRKGHAALADGRGGLALSIHKRSGEDLRLAGPLAGLGASETGIASLPTMLREARALFAEDVLSEGAPYDLDRGLVDVPEGAQVEVARRVLDRKRRKVADAAEDATRRRRVLALIDWAWRAEAGTPSRAMKTLRGLLLAGRFLNAHRPKSRED